MKSTAVTALKASLGKYINWVKAGEEVLVTERGKPVAKIIPVWAGEADHLKEMEKLGLIRLASGRLPDKFWEIQRPADKKGLALKALLEEREVGR